MTTLPLLLGLHKEADAPPGLMLALDPSRSCAACKNFTDNFCNRFGEQVGPDLTCQGFEPLVAKVALKLSSLLNPTGSTASVAAGGAKGPKPGDFLQRPDQRLQGPYRDLAAHRISILGQHPSELFQQNQLGPGGLALAPLGRTTTPMGGLTKGAALPPLRPPVPPVHPPAFRPPVVAPRPVAPRVNPLLGEPAGGVPLLQPTAPRPAAPAAAPPPPRPAAPATPPAPPRPASPSAPAPLPESAPRSTPPRLPAETPGQPLRSNPAVPAGTAPPRPATPTPPGSLPGVDEPAAPMPPVARTPIGMAPSEGPSPQLPATPPPLPPWLRTRQFLNRWLGPLDPGYWRERGPEVAQPAEVLPRPTGGYGWDLPGRVSQWTGDLTGAGAAGLARRLGAGAGGQQLARNAAGGLAEAGSRAVTLPISMLTGTEALQGIGQPGWRPWVTGQGRVGNTVGTVARLGGLAGLATHTLPAVNAALGGPFGEPNADRQQMGGWDRAQELGRRLLPESYTDPASLTNPVGAVGQAYRQIFSPRALDPSRRSFSLTPQQTQQTDEGAPRLQQALRQQGQNATPQQAAQLLDDAQLWFANPENLNRLSQSGAGLQAGLATQGTQVPENLLAERQRAADEYNRHSRALQMAGLPVPTLVDTFGPGRDVRNLGRGLGGAAAMFGATGAAGQTAGLAAAMGRREMQQLPAQRAASGQGQTAAAQLPAWGGAAPGPARALVEQATAPLNSPEYLSAQRILQRAAQQGYDPQNPQDVQQVEWAHQVHRTSQAAAAHWDRRLIDYARNPANQEAIDQETHSLQQELKRVVQQGLGGQAGLEAGQQVLGGAMGALGGLSTHPLTSAEPTQALNSDERLQGPLTRLAALTAAQRGQSPLATITAAQSGDFRQAAEAMGVAPLQQDLEQLTGWARSHNMDVGQVQQGLWSGMSESQRTMSLLGAGIGLIGLVTALFGNGPLGLAMMLGGAALGSFGAGGVGKFFGGLASGAGSLFGLGAGSGGGDPQRPGWQARQGVAGRTAQDRARSLFGRRGGGSPGAGNDSQPQGTQRMNTAQIGGITATLQQLEASPREAIPSVVEFLQRLPPEELGLLDQGLQAGAVGTFFGQLTGQGDASDGGIAQQITQKLQRQGYTGTVTPRHIAQLRSVWPQVRQQLPLNR